MTSMTMDDFETRTMTKKSVWDQLQQSRTMHRASDSLVNILFSFSGTSESAKRPDSTQYNEPTLIAQDLGKAALRVKRMDETFSKVEESVLKQYEVQHPTDTDQVALPAIDAEWSCLLDEFGPPDYVKMSQELRTYMADRGQNMDELLHKASVHFQTERPPIRQRPLTVQEIQHLIQEENDALNG